jgi:hypothetical protein
MGEGHPGRIPVYPGLAEIERLEAYLVGGRSGLEMKIETGGFHELRVGHQGSRVLSKLLPVAE